jgi:hypothetical protein
MTNGAGLRLPDFIGVGPASTGTTWLHAVLKHHLGLPKRYKEVRFFDRHYSLDLVWYADHFAQYPPQLKVGEITPRYLHSALARLRIAKDIPECKIVCTFREHAARMYSVYKLLRRQGLITEKSFEATLNKRASMIINHYRYAHDLGLWLDAFDREQVLVCLYDDLESDPQGYLDRITDFIGSARISLADSDTGSQPINNIDRLALRPRLAGMMWHLERSLDPNRSYKLRRILKRFGIWQYSLRQGDSFPPIEPEVQTRLRELFRSDVEKLEQMIGRDLSAWKRPADRGSPELTWRTSERLLDKLSG